MRIRNKLNVKQLPSLTSPGVYSDGGGLYIRVRPSGSRSWLYIGALSGKRREVGLGSVFDISLAQARAKAAEIRAAFLEGREPVARRALKAAPAPQQKTFGMVASDLMDDIEGGLRNDKHRKQWRSTLKTYAASLQELPVADITTEDVSDCLKPIWLKVPETARRVRGRIERVLDAAKAKGYRSGENPARLRGHLDLLLPRQDKGGAKHHAAMPFTEVSVFMVQLQGKDSISARALEFAILTAARTGEVLGMTWDEVDFDHAVWTIPGSRMKAGEEHQVPLSRAALAILKNLRDTRSGPCPIVLPGRGGSMLSNMAMTMLLRGMGHAEFTVHGFRSTFRDWAGEVTTFAREDVEMALAHTVASKTERAYRRGRALEKRRGLMQAWAAFCAGSDHTGQ